jgi:uncharacterized DUF497 family protein
MYALDVCTLPVYNTSMNFEWDESKRQTSIQKHGVDFIDIIPIFNGYAVSVEDQRFDYLETRYITIGMLKSLIIVVVVIPLKRTAPFVLSLPERRLNMKKNDTLNSSQTDWDRLAEMKDKEIDLSDIPELTDEQLKRMRPAAELMTALTQQNKERITIRIDSDVIGFFRDHATAEDTNYQTLINAVLRNYVYRQQMEESNLPALVRRIVREELDKAL